MTLEKRKQIVNYFLSIFKIAKTLSYINIDFDDIEDSLVVSSAKATGTILITRDKKLLQRYPDLAKSPEEFWTEIRNKKINISMLDLPAEVASIYSDIERAMDKVLNKCNFILGNEVKQLEEKIANYIGTKYAIGVSSGTDALVISLRALAIKIKGQEYWDKEDLIITTPFAFIATGDAILRAGATPFFVDIDPDTFNIDPEQIK
ncbi:MAG TPA: aminotransferase, partial [Candidatus Desulfofervidus auxilii]|nr:aminotransferase [Candidatus Desulfofervidus auxilii]